VEEIGWISTLCLTLCGIPELWKAVKKGRCDLTLGFISLWFMGEILGLAYAIYIQKAPIIGNYLFNSCVGAGLLWYKLQGIKDDRRR
jgi:uncharacterized protein with PQ loop repeat